MASFSRLLLVFALLCFAAATPTPNGGKKKCGKLAQRKAWHNFSNKEKRAYIDAELCLMSKPAQQQVSAAQTRFEELQGIHQVVTFWTHFVGAFLPWHRLFLLAHETLLRNECGYKGYQPYWEESLDAGHFINASILDPVTGFGGNGSGPNNCITDGPFKDFVNHVGPLYTNEDHCLNRKINETKSSWGAQHYVDACLAQPDYLSFYRCLEDKPHGSGHGGIDGLMLDPFNSPGDPLFYLHHAWMDKLWWDWQFRDLENRLADISGPNVMPADKFAFFPPPPADWYPNPSPIPGDPGNETTMNHVLDIFGVLPNRTITEVMDPRESPFCYEYVEPY